MSDIFISYDRSDIERAKVLANILEQQGWSVWWDRKIPAGKSFDEVIEEALGAAKCVIVLWSKESVKSDWVKEEATEGARRKILVPALIDDINIPLGFRRIQAAQLVGWQGDANDQNAQKLIEDIARLIGLPKVEKPKTSSKPLPEIKPLADKHKKTKQIIEEKDTLHTPVAEAETQQTAEEPEGSPTTISTDITGQEKPIIEETDLTSGTGVETEISQPKEKAEAKIPIEHPPIPPKRSSTTVSARMPTPMLVWLLPAILVPVISGIVVSVIVVSKRQPIIPPPVVNVKPPEKIEEASELPEKVEKVVVPEIPKVVEKPKTVEVPTKKTVPATEIKKMVFRSEPMKELSRDLVKSMLMKKGFFDISWNKNASGFLNNYELQHDGKVVFDRASGLMWQQSGSDKYMKYKDAKEYIDRLNREQFAGYSDWRLPTLEEAMTLMEPTKNKESLYIDPLFGKQQTWIWTSDTYSASSAWVVLFNRGDCFFNLSFFSYGAYVRAVR